MTNGTQGMAQRYLKQYTGHDVFWLYPNDFPDLIDFKPGGVLTGRGSRLPSLREDIRPMRRGGTYFVESVQKLLEDWGEAVWYAERCPSPLAGSSFTIIGAGENLYMFRDLPYKRDQAAGRVEQAIGIVDILRRRQCG